MICRLCYKVIVLNTLLWTVYCQTEAKGSLTFVIDSTLSMQREINSIKYYAEKIFDAVVKSNESQIDNFIIVTFQDPENQVRTITKIKDEFKKALNSIKVFGGGDCPEMAMSGIELGLRSSYPFSYLFVFTDATAKDYEKLEKVKHLALDSNIKITFLISEVKCPNEVKQNFKLYEILATKTGGEIFYLKKNKIPEILNYVRSTVKVRKTEIFRRTFLAKEEKKVNITLDSGIEVIEVSVTGSRPSIIIKDQFGNEVQTKDIVDITKVKIVTFYNQEPGSYDIEVDSEANTLVTVYGSSKVTFQYGFSVIKPSSLKDTTNRPIADRKSFVAIKLSTNGKNLTLQTLQILDLKDNIILEEPMRITNAEDHFYISEPILPPKDTFKIKIKAGDEITEETIKRVSSPVEPQHINFDTIEKKAPTVKIIGERKVKSDYGKPLQLKCGVIGYPEPDIVWEDEYGSTLIFKVSPRRIPYEYITVLDIDEVTTNNTFTCKARNNLGNDEKIFNVESNTYFEVIHVSKDKSVPYDKPETLFCKVKSNPPAIITWYQKGEMVKTDDYINISPDGSTLHIKRMKPKFAGKFICEVRNDIKRYIYNMQLVVTGVDAPMIDKNVTEMSVAKGSSTYIRCRILKGYPKPTIQWLFKSEKKEYFYPIPHKYNENLLIDNVTSDVIGTYKCVSRNEIDVDSHIVDLFVEYGPIIKDTTFEQIVKNVGQTVTIPCPVEGAPTPEVTWFLDKTIIEDVYPYRIYRNKTISFKVSVERNGLYTCEARNKLGSIKKTANISVCEPVTVDVPEETSLNIKVGTKLILTCEVKGYPKPKIRWSFINNTGTHTVKQLHKDWEFGAEGSLKIPIIQLINKGTYVCTAENCGGHINLTYSVFPCAPPIVIPTINVKNILAVNGDVALRIPCLVTGEPKPKIIWKKDGDLITDSEWYSVDIDDILVIKNIKKSSAGTYLCTAGNIFGIAFGKYVVNVKNYPTEMGKISTFFIEKNQTKEVECNIAHTDTDLIRWYKSGKIIAHGKLILTNVKREHHGYYKCRVSNAFKSYTGTVDVEVAEKPRFTFNEPTRTFLFDHNECLSCMNRAIPKAKTTWYFNKNRIDNEDMTHCFEKKVSSIGEYVCVVENEFGKIEKTLFVIANDCLLNIQTDFDRYHPLVLTLSFQFNSFYIKDEHLAIPQNENVQLFCHGGFNKFPGNDVKATCIEKKKFKIQETYLDYPKLKCKEPLQPHILKMDTACVNSHDGEFYQIGVYVKDFLEVYKVCFHKERKIPLYVEYSLTAAAAGVKSGTIKTWLDEDKVIYNRSEMYDCKKQKNDISLILGTPFHNENDWCFTARQLVNEKDVPPGFPQILTYSYLNIIPHWNSDNMKNWDALEELLRNEAKKNIYLNIRTGTSQDLQLPTTSGVKTVYIKDKAGNTMVVPVYLWKVITDEFQGASVAIIQLNLPDVSKVDVHKYVICHDICEKIHWMNEIKKNYYNNGFIYCCTILDFESAFGYKYLFNHGFVRVLNNF